MRTTPKRYWKLLLNDKTVRDKVFLASAGALLGFELANRFHTGGESHAIFLLLLLGAFYGLLSLRDEHRK